MEGVEGGGDLAVGACAGFPIDRDRRGDPRAADRSRRVRISAGRACHIWATILRFAAAPAIWPYSNGTMSPWFRTRSSRWSSSPTFSQEDMPVTTAYFQPESVVTPVGTTHFTVRPLPSSSVNVASLVLVNLPYMVTRPVRPAACHNVGDGRRNRARRSPSGQKRRHKNNETRPLHHVYALLYRRGSLSTAFQLPRLWLIVVGCRLLETPHHCTWQVACQLVRLPGLQGLLATQGVALVHPTDRGQEALALAEIRRIRPIGLI